MKPTEWGYGVQTSHLFPLVNHLGILHFSPSFSTLKIGVNTKSIGVNPWGQMGTTVIFTRAVFECTFMSHTLSINTV